MIEIKIKKFYELTLDELHDVLQLRSEVFIVEQDCVYHDIDGKDKKALHVIGLKNNSVVAYTRVFKSGDYFNFSSIGRVVVAKNERQYKYGHDIMQASLKAIKDVFKESPVQLSAQTYLCNFYINLGFKVVGEQFLEDGIPHITMIKE